MHRACLLVTTPAITADLLAGISKHGPCHFPPLEDATHQPVRNRHRCRFSRQPYGIRTVKSSSPLPANASAVADLERSIANLTRQ